MLRLFADVHHMLLETGKIANDQVHNKTHKPLLIVIVIGIRGRADAAAVCRRAPHPDWDGTDRVNPLALLEQRVG